ncbi:WYL domain-containing protein [Janibacter melonis]|uniref:helix-turn-helix transcriptional regulator n=1 Tax=Janibacter melonis TaxID=262209 RepID=UPI0020444E50|nr:WYL domain-containing protein [Janibacter melonis]MCM3554572.1 WYL domain-containing protein [Janibacter melonis]
MAVSNTPRAKTERLMNLTMCLLSTRRALPKARIRTMVEAYQGVESDEAFDRMFERDKDELRGLGIPLVTEQIGGAFEDEPGYRIDRRDYALPDLSFAPDELAVIGLASRVWSHAAMAPSAATAWRKVASLEPGDSGTEDPFVGIEPNLGGSEPAFPALQEATVAGRTVTFDYTRSGAAGPQTRRVDPWALTSWHGRWYLTGHDLDRDEQRIYRLSRISSDVRAGGEITRHRPDDLDPQQAVARFAEGDQAKGVATARVRTGAGHALRRRARSVEPVEDGWDRLELPYGSTHGLADELAGYGGDVVAESPDELVVAVRSRLDGVLASLGGAR